MVWVNCLWMASFIKGELYYHSVTTSMTSSGATVSVCTSESVSDTHAHTHTQTALSSTCLQCYLPQSLPGSQIPTVSAHVNSKITGHAHTHIFVLLLKGLYPSARKRYVHLPSSCSFFDKPRKQSRWGSKTQWRKRHEERRCVEMMDTHWWCNDKGGMVFLSPFTPVSADMITNQCH